MAKRLTGVFFTVALLLVVFIGFLVPSAPSLCAPDAAPSVLLDPYGPPYKTDGYKTDDSSRGVAINIETRGLGLDYTQLGILTRTGDLILPLMGRRESNQRRNFEGSVLGCIHEKETFSDVFLFTINKQVRSKGCGRRGNAGG